MKKLIVLRGLPASGKSTWVKEYNLNHVDSSVILSYDAIRSGLGVYWVPSRDFLVKEIFNASLRTIFTGYFDYDIIIDNTNLDNDIVKKLIDEAKLHGYEIVENIFMVSRTECQRRNEQRESHVTPEVIDMFYNKYLAGNDGKIIPVTDNPVYLV